MRYLFIVVIAISAACSNDLKQINEMFETVDTDVEYAENVSVIYSDSAKVRLKVSGPKLERYVIKNNQRDVFTDGVHVEFMDEKQRPLSWLDARYLEQIQKDGKVYVRDSVVLYNTENEKLETSELIWDEVSEKIYTDKFVRITQPEKGDTSYGYGFETDRGFNEFTIKKNFSAKMNVNDISKALGQ